MYDGHHACIFCFTSVHACIRITVTANRCAGDKIKHDKFHVEQIQSQAWSFASVWSLTMIDMIWFAGSESFIIYAHSTCVHARTMIIVTANKRAWGRDQTWLSSGKLRRGVLFVCIWVQVGASRRYLQTEVDSVTKQESNKIWSNAQRGLCKRLRHCVTIIAEAIQT